ncbi:aspartate aminotransferase family protein [Pusillimonas sp. SM2304]|uniref:aspartate aminotransferase family protein n=1 Tax=Pusillimonas sp. SM2304 TaxID=3073241 RepID=UPI00287577DC|nr:aspartate aminotransferase family protein [Pusillimonas sp. SM2304]MDS1139916.1 aspartate aminotransferase family protein [Pusillimonas sp. SM2304]
MAAVPANIDDLAALRQANVPRGVVTAHPIFVDRAQGSRVWTTDGREYLDFVGGIGVLNVGHNHPAVVEAVKRQLDRVTHMAFQVGAYDVYIDLARRLNGLVGQGRDYKSVFLTTGAEAVENAVKIARAYRNAPGIIAFRGGFHGRTLLGMTLTGMSEPYKQNFGPFAGDVHHTIYPDAYRGIDADAAMRELDNLLATTVAPSRVAAVLIEPVQGDGGFLYAGSDFLRKLRALTEKHGILLICDEIQTGFGRTGKLFGFEHSGIQPDLVTVAKSLAGGLPLSGVVGRADVMDAPAPGGLGGTYGGNALACAAALAVLDLFEQGDLLGQSLRLGEQLRAGLDRLAGKYSQIGQLRGIGPMLAMEFVKNGDPFQPDAEIGQRVIDHARELGLLVIKCGFYKNTVRLLAPLTTTAEEAQQALDILDQALARAVQ